NAAGLWAREVGRMVGLELPVLAMEHQYLVTEDMPELAGQKEQLHCIDFEGEIYMRQERGGMLMGTYERAGMPWSERVTPWDFGQDLLPNDLERIAPSLEVGFQHFPALGRVGIRKVVNGPFTFAPDGNPLVGPVKGLTNFWVACGVMAGFSQGGGVGLTLAQWMVDGDPGAECRAVRESVGLLEISNYGKFEVTGPGAVEWLSRMMANRVPAVGRIALTPMLNERGKLIGDFTMCRVSEQRVFLIGTYAAEN